MSDEWTPTTEQVRYSYSHDSEDEYLDPVNYGSLVQANRRAFNRWLAAHDAEIRAEVLPDAGWKPEKWHNLTSDGDDGKPTGDTIRLTWDDGTVLIGRLTVPTQGSGHHQIARMQTTFGGDTYVFPHGSRLEVKEGNR